MTQHLIGFILATADVAMCVELQTGIHYHAHQDLYALQQIVVGHHQYSNCNIQGLFLPIST